MEFISGVCNSSMWLNIDGRGWNVNRSVEYQAALHGSLRAIRELLDTSGKVWPRDGLRGLDRGAPSSRPVITTALAYHCLKRCSRCHLKKCGCGRSDMRCGASARPDLLIIDRTPCGSFVCREINISKSSAKPIRPRSNIQCAVPEHAPDR